VSLAVLPARPKRRPATPFCTVRERTLDARLAVGRSALNSLPGADTGLVQGNRRWMDGPIVPNWRSRTKRPKQAIAPDVASWARANHAQSCRIAKPAKSFGRRLAVAVESSRASRPASGNENHDQAGAQVALIGADGVTIDAMAPGMRGRHERAHSWAASCAPSDVPSLGQASARGASHGARGLRMVRIGGVGPPLSNPRPILGGTIGRALNSLPAHNSAKAAWPSSSNCPASLEPKVGL
jgi:hypothetical protein